MKFSLIVCVDNNNVIGKGNELIYHIKDDLLNFKRMTSDNVVIMGRKTYESLPKRPLPNRVNIIITRDVDYKVDNENVIVAHSVDEVISICDERFSDKECFVIGGGQIYSEFLNLGLINKMCITRVFEYSDGDTYFPKIDETEWKLYYSSSCQLDRNEDRTLFYDFKIYIKK